MKTFYLMCLRLWISVVFSVVQARKQGASYLKRLEIYLKSNLGTSIFIFVCLFSFD